MKMAEVQKKTPNERVGEREVPSVIQGGLGSFFAVIFILINMGIAVGIIYLSISDMKIDAEISGMKSCLAGALSVGIFHLIIATSILIFEFMTCFRSKPYITRLKAICILLALVTFGATVALARTIHVVRKDIKECFRNSPEKCPSDNSEDFKPLQSICVVSCFFLIFLCLVTADLSMCFCCSDNRREKNNALIRKFFSRKPKQSST